MRGHAPYRFRGFAHARPRPLLVYDVCACATLPPTGLLFFQEIPKGQAQKGRTEISVSLIFLNKWYLRTNDNKTILIIDD